MPDGSFWAIGLMSGTSMDGVDAALVETDGETVAATGPFLTISYDEGFRDALRTVLGRDPLLYPPPGDLVRDLTLRHVAAVHALLDKAGIAPAGVRVVGFHGQTVFHRPDMGVTRQIGDGALLARETGIDVVCDLRADDVENGGEGAPLVPVYHRALAAGLARPVAVLNLGGVANVTWVGDGEPDSDGGDLLAFDTGPGNALIDDWVRRHTGEVMDRDGALAATGHVRAGVLKDLAENDYFDREPPKSLDRDDFAEALDALGGMSAADGAATLAAFTAAAVDRARHHFPRPPRRWLVAGGGRHNPAVMAQLRRALPAPVEPVEAVGWDGDALEAQAFAFLAARALRGLPLTYPTTTGVGVPASGGRLIRAR